MEPLHAPWRIAYIRGPKPAPGTAQLFKRIAESSDDMANYVVVRDRTCFAVLNRYPYTGGHLMVVPYKASPDLNGLTEEELCDLMKLTRRCQNALTKVMKPDGFNIGINLGTRRGRGHHRASAHPYRPALERRHEFHAGARQHHGAARSTDRCGGTDCAPRWPPKPSRCPLKRFISKTRAWPSNCSTTNRATSRRWQSELAVKAVARENWIKLEGPAEAIERAKQLFQLLENSVQNGGTVRNREFAHALNVVKNEGVARLAHPLRGPHRHFDAQGAGRAQNRRAEKICRCHPRA